MKNKFVSKWLHRLPVLLVACIMLITPLSMAVPVSANSVILSGMSSDPYFFYEEDGSDNLYVYYPFYADEYHKKVMVLFIPDNTGNSLCLACTDRLVVNEDGSFNLVAARIYDINIVRVEGNSIWFGPLDDGSFTPSKHYDNASIAAVWVRDDPVIEGVNSLPWPVILGTSPGVLTVFSGVGAWLSGAVQNISTMFWSAESGMTVLGYLAVASLALAVILLIFYLIVGWLKFH